MISEYNLAIHNLKVGHSPQDYVWIHKRINAFLQTDRPKEAIFNPDSWFGIELYRHGYYIEVKMIYDEQRKNKTIPDLSGH